MGIGFLGEEESECWIALLLPGTREMSLGKNIKR